MHVRTYENLCLPQVIAFLCCSMLLLSCLLPFLELLHSSRLLLCSYVFLDFLKPAILLPGKWTAVSGGAYIHLTHGHKNDNWLGKAGPSHGRVK